MEGFLGGTLILTLLLLAAVAATWPMAVLAHIVWRIALSGWGWA